MITIYLLFVFNNHVSKYVVTFFYFI